MAPLIPIALSLAQAGYQFYQGEKQAKMAKELKPSNYVPNSVNEAVDNSRMHANTTQMPGSGTMFSRLRTGTANTIDNAARSTSNPNTLQQIVADTDAREKEVMKDISIANESYKANNRTMLNNALRIKGSHEKESWDAYNATKSALMGASMRNKYNAVSGLAENMIYTMPDGGLGKKTGGGPTASMTPHPGTFTNGINLKYGYPGGFPSAPSYSQIAGLFRQQLANGISFNDMMKLNAPDNALQMLSPSR